MDKYPLPDYAVSVWIAGDNLMVAFPGQGTDRGHTIKLPASQAGLATAIKIMRERETAKDLRLSAKGTPTKWEVETDKKYKAWLGALRADKTRKASELAEAEELLKEIGL